MSFVVSKQNNGIHIDKIAIAFISAVLMILALVGSVKLLNWAIDRKLTSSQDIVASKITADYREKQLACLARNIYFEAGNQPFEGKVAVAQVTINRAEHGGFPDDICQVVYQKNKVYDKVLCQFSWYCDRATGTRPLNNEAYTESMVVAKKVLLEGFRLPSLEKALYFHADYVNPQWKKEKVAKIGQHIFYK
jgi:spore germination cell wall hydrolase CwlJ-like protein